MDWRTKKNTNPVEGTRTHTTMRELADLNTAFGLDSPDPTWGSKQQRKSKPRRDRTMEPFVPAPPTEPDPDRPAQHPPPPADLLQGPLPPVQGNGRLDAHQPPRGGGELFPFPGETSEPEEWARAFTLEGSGFPAATGGAVSVDGQPTLWRQVPRPAGSQPIELSRDSVAEIHRRLDKLTKQLEEMGSPVASSIASWTPSGVSSNADLFLFVAIGLLFLLAIDTLLRFATARTVGGSVKAMSGGGGRRGGGRWRASTRGRRVFV